MSANKAGPDRKEILVRLGVTAGLSALLMLLAPLAILNFASAGQGPGLVVLLYYWINPLFAAGVGFYAGGDVQGRWYLVLVPALLYPLFAWATSGWSLSLLQTAAMYLLSGCLFLAVRRMITLLRKGR